MTKAVTETLDAIPHDPRDAGVRELAMRYAAEIDLTGTTQHLGSRLLSALSALQATPAARRDVPGSDSPVDELAAFLDDPAAGQ